MNAVALRVSNDVVVSGDIAGLPELVRKAAAQLAAATTAAEVLEAKASAGLAYDAAKAAARFAKAKGAYDDVIGAVYRAQADALEIEAMAKRRFADELDAAQARGEVGVRTGRPKVGFDDNGLKPARITDTGLSANAVHDARKLRNILNEDPYAVKDALADIIADGKEPTRHALSREINTRLSSFSGDNEWYTPARYVDMAREVMGSIDTDPASNPTAQRTVRASTYYTEETNGLDKEWLGKVWMNPPYSNPEVQQFADKVIAEYRSGRVTEAIVLTNNSADTGWHRSMQDACTRMCTTTGRIRFESPTRQGNSPAMGQSFFYFGDNPQKFKEVFSAIGNVWMLA
ncbi:DNA N-6-adenine-methyltransferase [Rhizobium leucaenae]|uniref:DNA N-6-adenine-methyltransferase n=1 Tax=Rhizobium leucaenae TaxID=29450 RepID=UPI00161CA66C|nr:DNA N-6-adenine-methyltransferase [Rhizobium leucaenae]MBB6299923.1 phage N-6-adenine-methyltransferase [Rhizobium leucaenae]